MRALKLFGTPHRDDPCPSCLKSIPFLRRESLLLPLPEGAWAPLSQVKGMGPICFDCAATETLRRVNSGLTWEMARVAIANDRAEKIRLPGAPIGLPFVRAAKTGDLHRLFSWQRKHFPEELTT